jgi:hypothetical protein
VHARAGRVLAALLASGARSRARHRRPRAPHRIARAGRGGRQPRDHRRRPGRVQRQLPRRTRSGSIPA